MTHVSRTALLAVACFLSFTDRAFALSTADIDCRGALGKSAAQVAQTVLTEQAKCHKKRMGGDADFATIDCNDLAQLPPQSLAKITKTRDKLVAAGGIADSECAHGGATVPPAAVGYTSCPAPCGGESVADYLGVGACLACLAESEAALAVQTAFGSSPPIVGKTDALKCQDTIASAQRKYALGRMKEQQRCQLSKESGLPPTTPTTDCETADLDGKVAKLRAKADAAIAKKCASSLPTLTSCGADVTAEQSCIGGSVEAGTGRLFDATYPPILPVHVPPSYVPGTPMPLVVLLHGYGATGPLEDAYFNLLGKGFGPLSDQRGFLYAFPDGAVNSMGKRFWNATDACCNFDGTDIDHSAALRGLIDDISAALSVDPKRIYIVGHSNGGFMAYRLACDHADTIAAVVSLAGAMYADVASCSPSEPVSVLQIHGTADDTIAYDGGSTVVGQGGVYPSAATTVNDWVTLDGCSGTADAPVPPIDLVRNIAGAETSVTRYSAGCAPGGHAELWTMNGGGHIPTLTGTVATRIVDFLFAHPKP